MVFTSSLLRSSDLNVIPKITSANYFHVYSCHRSEFDGDLQSQLVSKANEEDRNCSRALSVVSTVVRAAKDLLHRALAVDGKTVLLLSL